LTPPCENAAGRESKTYNTHDLVFLPFKLMNGDGSTAGDMGSGRKCEMPGAVKPKPGEDEMEASPNHRRRNALMGRRLLSIHGNPRADSNGAVEELPTAGPRRNSRKARREGDDAAEGGAERREGDGAAAAEGEGEASDAELQAQAEASVVDDADPPAAYQACEVLVKPDEKIEISIDILLKLEYEVHCDAL